jgi:lycopene cyclase domain-containing protein
MTYALLNLLFLIPVLLLGLFYRSLIRGRVVAATLLVLLIMTAIFDNFIVGSGIVAYDPNLLLGIYLGYAPLEDFAYTVVAALLIPICWWWLERREQK